MVFPGRDQKNCVLFVFISIVLDDNRTGSFYDKKDFIGSVKMVEKTALINLSNGLVVLKKDLLVFNIIIHIYTVT